MAITEETGIHICFAANPRIFILKAKPLAINPMKNIVVIGFIGTQLDAGKAAGRWEKWLLLSYKANCL